MRLFGLFRGMVRNSDSLRSPHSGHKGDPGATRPFLVFHLDHSSAYAGGWLEGIAPGRIEVGISFHRHGHRVSRGSGLRHAIGAGAPFAKSVDFLREPLARPEFVLDGLRQLAVRISVPGGPRWRGVDTVRNRALDRHSACNARLG
jgi:hypothetical protein